MIQYINLDMPYRRKSSQQDIYLDPFLILRLVRLVSEHECQQHPGWSIVKAVWMGRVQSCRQVQSQVA